MRHLLISAAGLLLAVPVFLAPAGAQPTDPSQIRGKGGFGQYQQQQAQNGGPTSFTNQIQGQQPGPNGEPVRGDRGGARGQQQVQPSPQPQAAPQGRDYRQQGRDYSQDGRDYRQGGNNGRYDSRGSWDNNNRGWDNNRGRNDYRSGSNGRRDWRSYGNYHRDWRTTRRYRAGAYDRPRGWYSHRWTFGEVLPSLFWARDYWLDYRLYDLPPPPYGAVWVRVADDALLIDRETGEVITVSYNVFY